MKDYNQELKRYHSMFYSSKGNVNKFRYGKTKEKSISTILKKGKAFYLEYNDGKNKYFVFSNSEDNIYKFLLKKEISFSFNNDLDAKISTHKGVEVINYYFMIGNIKIDSIKDLDYRNFYFRPLNINIEIRDNNIGENFTIIENVKLNKDYTFSNYMIKRYKGKTYFFNLGEKEDALSDLQDFSVVKYALPFGVVSDDYKENPEYTFYNFKGINYVIKNNTLKNKNELENFIIKDNNIKELPKNVIKGNVKRFIFKNINPVKIKKINNNLRYKENFRSKYLEYFLNKEIKEELVLIDSNNGREFNGNMLAIYNEIKKRGFKIVVGTNSPEKYNNIYKEDVKNHEIKFSSLTSDEYISALATAKFIYTDTTLPFYYIKKKNQVVVNTWHGTPLKKLGFDVEKLGYKSSVNVQKNLKLADFIFLPNEFTINVFKKSYSLSGENIYLMPNPKSDYLFKEVKENSRKKVLFMPTWRDELIENQKVLDRIAYIIKNIDSEKYDVRVKLHPIASNKFPNLEEKYNFKELDNSDNLYEELNSVDILISDYSSIIFDFSLKNKPIILDIFDYEQYKESRGFYLDIEKLPFQLVKTKKDLLKAIEENENVNYDDFNMKYNPKDNIKGSEEIVDFVLKGETNKINKKTKESILLFPGNLAINGITTSFLSLISTIDRSKYDLNIFVISNILNNYHEEALDKVRELGINVIVGAQYKNLLKEENIPYFKEENRITTTKNDNDILNNFYKREVSRIFNNREFDHLIHFTGYDFYPMKLFMNMSGKKHIFVHNDMFKEYKMRKNFNYQIIKEAYKNFDSINLVHENLLKGLDNDLFNEVNNLKDKLNIVNNTIDFDSIKRRSKEDVDYITKEIEEILNDKDIIKFINIGRLSKEKGQDRLIRAFNKVSDDNQDKKLVLFIVGGQGNERNNIYKLKENSKYKENIIIFENINPMPLLKRTDLFVLSSHYEGIGLVMHEALTLGVPVLSCEIAGPREFLSEGYGTLCDNSEEGLYKGLQQYIDGKILKPKKKLDGYNKKAIKEFNNILEK